MNLQNILERFPINIIPKNLKKRLKNINQQVHVQIFILKNFEK